MDSIIVKTKDDMERILRWVHDYLKDSEEMDDEAEFHSPFQKGEICFPFDGCRMEFQCDGDSFVRFKLYPILESFRGVDWIKDMKMKDSLLGEFLFNIETREISQKKFAAHGAYKELSTRYERDNHLFPLLTLRWFALMLMAVHYRPQFDRKRQVTISDAKRKSKKSKRSKKMKMLYTRVYIIDDDFMDELPKPKRKRNKPDHEYSVHGHYRRCKSGKIVWIRPHIRCKGNKASERNIYIAKIEESGE